MLTTLLPLLIGGGMMVGSGGYGGGFSSGYAPGYRTYSYPSYGYPSYPSYPPPSSGFSASGVPY
jgi:hypothetical protein